MEQDPVRYSLEQQLECNFLTNKNDRTRNTRRTQQP